MTLCLLGGSLLAPNAVHAADAPEPAKPNFLVILTDDVGWGDYACYNHKSKIPAPNVDRLAREGMRFTHAHTPAALCAPTRYSILTGNHPWRGRAPGGTWGFHAPSQILPGQKTVADLLQKAGYHTAMFGKQGFGGEHAKLPGGNPDFTQPMVEGPRAWGFDYSAIIPRGHQALPHLFLVNELPEVGADKLIQGKTLQRGVCVEYTEPGWDPAKVGGRLLDHAGRFLDLHQRERKGSPFFMHFCTDGAHSPFVPADEIRGTPLKGQTKMTEHTDMVLEPDLLLGKLMEMLEQRGLLSTTVICFTSDNGGLPYERHLGHDAVGGLRGKKSFLFEGGHRVPFLIRWPDKIAAGSVRDQFVCTHDIAPTMLELAGTRAPDDQCLDAVSLAPVLLGRRDDSQPVRRAMLIDSSAGRDVDQDGGYTDASVALTKEEAADAVRQRAISARAAGKGKTKGAGKPRPDKLAAMPSNGIAHALYEGDFKLMLDIPHDAPAALYHLKNDPTEQKNLIDDPEQAGRIKNMEATYRAIRASKRSVEIIAAPTARP
jgi:arylsulfatase A-like enzyme